MKVVINNTMEDNSSPFLVRIFKYNKEIYKGYGK